MSKEIIDESEYLRVTTCLAKYSGYDKVPLNILDYAADRGTRVHDYCELYANNMLFGPIDNDCVEYVQAFVNWFDEHCERVIFTEKRLFCNHYMIQGKPDLVCVLKNSHFQNTYCVADIKTSLKYSKTWDLQTAAYKHLCIENGISVENRIIVHVHKDAAYDIIDYNDYEDRKQYSRHLNTYAACLKAHRFFS